MSNPQIDTSIIIRLLTGDDINKQQAARKLFLLVESGALIVSAPVTAIADAVYVLHSKQLYAKSREEVASLLLPLVGLVNFKIPQKTIVIRALVIRALEVFDQSKVDFGDAMLIASAERTADHIIYSYDEDFDKIPTVRRVEP